MSEPVVILVTVATQEDGQRIARHLVESHLAGCVNITGALESIYRWEGAIAQDREYQLIIKSTRALFPQVEAAISGLHTYQTPEIICLPIVAGSEKYLRWLQESVAPGSSGEGEAPG